VRLIVQGSLEALGAVGDLNDILRRAESSLGPRAGAPVALDGGITNRNFRVTLGSTEYVIRRPGKDTALLGIDRDAERLANEAAARLGIAPAVALVLDDCLVTRFVSCAEVGPQGVADGVEDLARALRGFHESRAQLPASFRVGALLERYAAIVIERGGTLPGAYSDAVAATARIEAALPVREPRPCHNDLLPGNVIRDVEGGTLLIVDWEYAAMGDQRFDLGNLSVNSDFDDATDERLLGAYLARPPSDGERSSLKLMRVLSDAREAAWGVVQGELSELDFDFEGYAREHFDRLRAVVEEPRFERWLDSAESEASSVGGQAA
jgi:thiamine kinase-like enzyme